MLSERMMPSAEEAVLSDHLREFIAERIASAGGEVSFAEFMQWALYAPQLGYYSSGLQKFGAGGDFVTAPHISPYFSRALQAAIVPVLQQPGTSDLLEIGAGDGTLAAQLLPSLFEKDAAPRHYFILELSAELKQRQKEKIKKCGAECLSCVRWLDRLPEKPWRGVVLANEVLDAMPVTLFSWHHGKLTERVVTCQRNNHLHADDASGIVFSFKERTCSVDLQRSLQPIMPYLMSLDPNMVYHSDINLQAPAWIKGISDVMQQGVMLCFDYGYPRSEYYHPQRDEGTLMCYRKHQAYSDPFLYPGISDMTAHVDFTQIAEAAVDAGFSVDGYTTQGSFLLNCGITQFIEEESDPLAQYQKSRQLQQLISPQHMGESFKVMWLSKDLSSELKSKCLGFQDADMRGRLLGFC